MSRVNQDLVSRVRFEADSRMASASMDALRTHADKLSKDIEDVNANIKALGNVPLDDKNLVAYQTQLKKLKSAFDDVNRTMKDYTRGVKAAGELYRNYAMGDIESMSIKAIKAGVNGMKKRYDNLKAGGDPADAEEMRLITTIINEADVVVKRFQADYQNVAQQIASGATFTEQTLRKTRDGLNELMQTAESSTEKAALQNYLQQVNAALEKQAAENRRLKGEVADRAEAIRIANEAEHQGSQQAIRDAEARATAAAKENEEIGKRLAANREEQRELQRTMDANSVRQQLLMDQKREAQQREKDERLQRSKDLDDARREQNAARRAAKEQQTAYDEQKTAVEQLRTEVQGLTEDLAKMGSQTVKPKVDTSKLERDLENAKQDLKEVVDDERKANEALKQFGITTADIADEAKLQIAAEKALKAEEESRLELARQMLQVRKEIGAEELKRKDSRLFGTKDTQAFYAKNKDVLDDEYWKSEAGGGGIRKMYQYLNDISDDPEAKADFKEQVGMTVKDAMRVAGQRIREVLQRGIQRGVNVEEALEYFDEGHGPAVHIKEYLDELNQDIEEKEQELISKRRKQLDAISDAVYEPGDEMDSREERMRLIKDSLKGIGTGHYGTDTPLSENVKQQREEVARLEEEIKKATQSTSAQADASGDLAKKQEELAQKQGQLAEQEKKLNEEGDKLITASQRRRDAEEAVTRATDAQAEANKHRGESVQKLDEQLHTLVEDQGKNAQAMGQLTRAIDEDTAAIDRNLATQQQASREADQLRTNSLDKMKQARDRLVESNAKLDPVIDREEWEKGERAIGNLTQRMEDLKKRQAELQGEARLQMMTDRMKNIGLLSKDALDETKKFWEQMAAGAENGNTKLREYEQHLKAVAEEENGRVRARGMEAFDFFSNGKYKTANATETDEQRKALIAYRDALPAEGRAERIAEINTLLEKQAQAAKEASGEWMSLADAEKLASKAGTDGFYATQQQMTQAVQAIERKRDALIKTIQQKQNDPTADIKKEQEELKRLDKVLKDLKFEQDNFNMSHKQMDDLLKQPKSAEDLNQLKAAIKRADGELHRMKQSLGENSKQYKDFAAQVKQAKNVLKEMEGQAKATSSAFEKAWSRLKTYVGLYVGAAVAMQKLVGTMGDIMTLSDKMGEVRKTTGFTADEVGRLSDNLRKLDVRTSLTSLMETAAKGGQLGLKTEEDVLGFTEAANKLMIALPEMGQEAATEIMKVATATGEVDKIRRQMQEGLVEGDNAVSVALTKIGSTIDQLRANSAAAAPAITDFVKRVGAVGAQSGISIDQIAALGSTVDALGMRVEMSATALSRMIPAIKNNAFAIGKIIGKTETEIRQKFEKGMGIEVILDIFDAIKKSGRSSADDVEQMFGGSMQEIMKELNQQGARAGIVFAGLSQNVDELRRQLGIASQAYEENMAIQREFDKMNDTTAAKWERLKNDVEEMFVGDQMQRSLGVIIDFMREFVKWFSSDGPLSIGFKMMLMYATTMKLQFGAAFVGIGGGIKTMTTALTAGVNVLATGLGSAINSLTGTTNALRGVRAATIGARREWVKMNAAMKANVIGAIITALGYLVYKLWDIHQAAKEAAAEVGRFNQKVSEEQRALNNLFEPLKQSNTAQEERMKLIAQINSQYSKYLGYMLSETTSAQQLAEAHALIAKRIREEAYERRIMEKERSIQESHNEDLNAAYGKMSDRVRSGIRGGADVQEVTDILKGIVDNRIGDIKYAYDNSDNIFSTRTRYYLDPKIKQAIDGGIERLVVDGKLSRDNVSLIQKAVYKYTVEAKSQHDDIMSQTSNMRSDLRGIQGAIKTDLTNNLNSLIQNVVNSVKTANNNQQQPGGGTSPYLQRPQENGLPSLFGSGQQGGADGGFQFPWQTSITTEQPTMPLPGSIPRPNKKNVEEVRAFVQAQDQLRGALETSGKELDEDTRRIAQAYLVADSELDEMRRIVTKADRDANGGGGGNHPYGSYNVMDSYDKWDADALVGRKKQMLDYVKKLANGADVQAVLKQDAKFIDEATRKGIKDVRGAIEWYNSERLKIQQELAARHLTNEGNWANPAKAKNRKKRQVYSEEAVAELDRYYAWRKEELERQRTEEGISEAEYNRRVELMEQEHLKKRSDLRRTFTSNEKEFVEQFWKWWASVRELNQDIDRELIDAEWKVATARDKAYNDRDAQRDLAAMRAIVVKQMKAIEDIIAKERPYNGITENLEENLTKMGILFADFDKKRREALERGASKDEIDEIERQSGAERFKRLSFLMQEAEHAYTLTWDDLKQRMKEKGLGDLADVIASNENGDRLQMALIAELHQVYDKVQDAVKKESSIIKKHAENIWNDLIPGGDMSMKDSFEKAISDLGLMEDQVKRANGLINAGTASERVADRLAIKQMEMRLAMQQTYYALMQQEGLKRIAFLKEEQRMEEAKAKRHEAEAKRLREQGKEQEAIREETAAEDAMHRSIQARLDAEHASTSLQLAKTKELAEEEKQRVAIQNQLEESQNRLYTSLREWADLLASSVQSLFEAEHAGDAEYYNELAKLNLTGKGGPGAGTYVVIDNEGTSDAKAHYEYLDERQALERQHEIEQENARAEAWKKVMDDLNQKMSDTITDQINAMLQNAAVNANTKAVDANTEALKQLEDQLADGVKVKSDKTPDATKSAVDIAKEATKDIKGSPRSKGLDKKIDPHNASTWGHAARKREGLPVVDRNEPDSMPSQPMPEMNSEASGEMERNTQALQELTQALGFSTGEEKVKKEKFETPEYDESDPSTWGRAERKRAGYRVDDGGEPDALAVDPMTAVQAEIDADNTLTEVVVENAKKRKEAKQEASSAATATVVSNNEKEAQSTKENNEKEKRSTQSAFAAMAAACNMYGIAYQAVTNDNLDTQQKFMVFALQAAGQTAIGMLTTNMLATDAQGKIELPGILGKAASQLGPIAGPIAFAAMTALLGGLMGMAMSKVTKAKSQISQVTGASASAGKLATGMLTYAEGNVNEFTDPATLTPGRSYNVDGADGKTYRARYTGKNPRTHITNGPEFHLVGEAGREAIIDAKTTRLLQMDESGIWRTIQTLYNGGSITATRRRRSAGRGMPAFADGNLDDFEAMTGGTDFDGGGDFGMSMEQAASLQASIDRQSEIQEALLERLNQGIKAVVSPYGPDGIVHGYDKYKKQATRNGQSYI